jgi:hypothetical protein
MKINKKSYKALPLSFNVVCQLEDLGLQIADIEGKYMSVFRGWLAICMNKDMDEAGAEIEKHCENGGDLNEILDEFGKSVENSGFFQALSRTAEETPQETPKKKTAKKEE